MSLFKNAVQTRSFQARDLIFREGEKGAEMYVVQEGHVQLIIGGQVVEEVGPDGIFGEMALLDAHPRSATAVAATACKLVQVDQKHFTFMVQETPFFAIDVMRNMARRLRRMDERI